MALYLDQFQVLDMRLIIFKKDEDVMRPFIVCKAAIPDGFVWRSLPPQYDLGLASLLLSLRLTLI